MSKTRAVKKITSGLLSATTDFILLALFYGIEVSSSGYSGLTLSGTEKAGNRAHEDFEKLNSKTIGRALRQLKTRGLIQTLQGSSKELAITKQGELRLHAILPYYQNKRVWDGVMYTITYDIPIDHNKDRDMLRLYLRKIGCGLLQESVWITPYNPTDLIRKFAQEKGLEGTILVSSLGKGGTIGDMTFDELIERVYKLRELSDAYEQFILKYKRKMLSKAQVMFEYLSVLEKDPQLPFELLPNWWRGDEAYKTYSRFIK